MTNLLQEGWQYDAANVNNDVPIQKWAGSISKTAPLIDAVFIPTQSHRPLPETSIQMLKKHCKNIYFLFSDDPAEWVHEYAKEKKIFIWRNLSKKRKSSKFYNYASSKNSSRKFKPEYDIPYMVTFFMIIKIELFLLLLMPLLLAKH